MSAAIGEWESYQDESGKPIVNGFVYYGKVNSDPTIEANQINIFADRELTIALANPQRTDSFGKTASKVWLSGKYSKIVQDANAVQVFSDPDSGEETTAANVSLTNVQGANDITAEGVPALTAYSDLTTYGFIAAGINTGNVTLDIDGIGPKSVIIQGDLELSPDNIITSQVVQVTYNETNDIFELVSNIANDEGFIIKLWSGTIATIPNGFQLCDGTNGSPDLRNSFVIGAGDTYAPGDTGGDTVTEDHILVISEIPAHDHSYTRVVSQSQNAQTDNDVQATNQNGGDTTGSTGGGGGHSHTQNLPPFFAEAYIIRI